MAAFASDRRSGWVRVLVLILCALFIFATIATPPAYAVGETVAVFGLAAVLSAATAALGFKLANNAEGQATLQKMVQDFAGASISAGLVLTGSKVNGLINGMQYIKMAVHNGKTYLDERIFAWCQQWLAQNGVYDAGSIVQEFSNLSNYGFNFADNGFSNVSGCLLTDSPPSNVSSPTVSLSDVLSYYNVSVLPDEEVISYWNTNKCAVGYGEGTNPDLMLRFAINDGSHTGSFHFMNSAGSLIARFNNYLTYRYVPSTNSWRRTGGTDLYLYNASTGAKGFVNFLPVDFLGNDTGLSGTDTLGKDVIDLTLDQILQKLKEWAQDWYDAGADSVTNAATGAKDLPLSVTAGAATLNPDVAEDGPLIYFPAFGWSLPQLRSGETDSKTVDQGKENASAAETSTVDVAENQTVINSLVSWALNYIDPDTGLFSKFPLCVPYDAYLLVTSSLGVEAVGSDSIFGASPGDLDGVVTESIDTYSDFQPIININNDFELDGKTYPISISIDLTPWQPLVTFFREGMALLLVAELIGSEYKRIRGH